MAKLISFSVNATIFTYGLPVDIQFTEHLEIEVIFIGGKLNKSAQVTVVGIDVINSISQLRADICFMGTNVEKGMIASSDYYH